MNLESLKLYDHMTSKVFLNDVEKSNVHIPCTVRVLPNKQCSIPPTNYLPSFLPVIEVVERLEYFVFMFSVDLIFPILSQSSATALGLPD